MRRRSPQNERRFRWLLRLLPAAFREAHEVELLRVWREEQRESDGAGRVWRAALVDTARIAPREHALEWMRNVRRAARGLRRTPGFTATAVVTLALGVGAAAAVFSLVNAVLLRPLPWSDPDTVGLVWAITSRGERTWLSFPELQDIQQETRGASAVAGLSDLRFNFLTDRGGREIQALAVSHNLFASLGVRPELGRDFDRDDDRPGAAPAAILSHGFWKAQFGSDPAVVGRSIVLNERPYAIVGVLPETFSILPPSSVFPDRVDVWVTLEPHLVSRDRSVRFLHALIRLRDAGTFADVERELGRYGDRARREFAAAYPGGNWRFIATSFTGDVLASARRVLLLLSALVALVLFMACANVGNLLLARGESRRRELAIRTALGAGRARLAGELLAEALVLAALGAGLGAGLALVLPRVLARLDPGALPRLGEATVDGSVLVFILALMLFTAVLSSSFALVERFRLDSLMTARPDRLRARGRTARVGRALVLMQTALATTVVVAAIFLLRAFGDLERTELGFDPHNVLTGRVSLSPKYRSAGGTVQFFDAAVDAVRGVPGVEAAAAVTQLPLTGEMLASTFLMPPETTSTRIDADLRGVTPDYFAVMKMPLLAGRSFTPADTASSGRVAIVDASFARELGGPDAALGRRIRWIRQPDADLEIVGVTGPVRHRGPHAAPRQTVFRPHAQYPRASMFIVARTSTDAAAAAQDIRNALAEVDPSQAFADVATLEARLHRSLARIRTSAMLAFTLGLIALTLAAVGLYGVLGVHVEGRLQEFGIRLAVGATPRQIRFLVLRDGMATTLAGAAIGSAAANAVLRAAQTVVPATPAASPAAYALGALIVLGCAASSFWVPARRASNLDPIRTLRAE